MHLLVYKYIPAADWKTMSVNPAVYHTSTLDVRGIPRPRPKFIVTT